jgi:hypothetical protein
MNELKCTMFIDLINIITLQITKKNRKKGNKHCGCRDLFIVNSHSET